MIVTIILSAVIVIQAIIHFIERRDMTNRLMSKSYAEYKNSDIPPYNTIPSAHSKVLNRWRNKKGGDN